MDEDQVLTCNYIYISLHDKSEMKRTFDRLTEICLTFAII